MRSFVKCLLVCGIVLGTAALTLVPADGQPNKKPGEGKKPGNVQAGKGAVKISVERTKAGGWHVDLHAPMGSKHNFDGTITVQGGNFSGVTNIVPLDPADFVRIDGNQQVLRFHLNYHGKKDGFNFKVTPKTEKITFTLLVDGQSRPNAIVLDGGKHPKSSTFTLPAHPKGKK